MTVSTLHFSEPKGGLCHVVRCGLPLLAWLKKSADTDTTRLCRIRLELDHAETNIRYDTTPISPKPIYDTTPTSTINRQNLGNLTEMLSYLSRLGQHIEKKNTISYFLNLFSHQKKKKNFIRVMRFHFRRKKHNFFIALPSRLSFQTLINSTIME